MASPIYSTALIVGAGQGLSASLTAPVPQGGPAVAIAARDPAKLASLCSETGARAYGCDAQDEAQVRSCSPTSTATTARRTWSSITPAARTARTVRRARRRRSPARVAGHRVRRVSGGAAGRGPDAAQRTRRDLLHRRVGEREGIRAVGAVRGWESLRCAVSRRALPANCRRRESTSRTSSSTARSPALDGAAIRHRPDALLDPDAIALTYLGILRQPRSAWTCESSSDPGSNAFNESGAMRVVSRSRLHTRQRHPPRKKRDTADRRDGAEAADAGQRERVEAAREEHDPGEEQPRREPEEPRSGQCSISKPAAEAQCVPRVVLDGGLPHGCHLGRQPALSACAPNAPSATARNIATRRHECETSGHLPLE